MLLVILVTIFALPRVLLEAPGVALALAQRTLPASHRSRPLRETSEEVGLQSNLGTCGVIRGVSPPSLLVLDLTKLNGLDSTTWRPSRPCKTILNFSKIISIFITL